MPHPTLTIEELKKFADEHLRYEIDMLISSAQFDPQNNQFLMNMKVESFVTHLRNLIDFFYLATPKPDDVVAIYYFSNEDAKRNLIPAITESLENAKTRANKELSHLTTKRIHGYAPKKVWQMGALAAEILQLLKIFKTHAEPNTLSSDFMNHIQEV